MKINSMNGKRSTVMFVFSFMALAAAALTLSISAQAQGKKKAKKKKKEKTAKVEEEKAAEEEVEEEPVKVEKKEAPEEEVDMAAKEEAADLFFEGVILFDQGKFASALEKFSKSYALHNYWKTLYNIGMCYLELNDQPSAASALSQFLDEGAGKIQKEIVESVAGTLKKIKAKVGIIRLTGYLEGGMLTIDGVVNKRGAEGADVYVTPGVHHVKLESGQLLLLDKKITIEGGEEKEIFVVEPTEDMIQKAQIIEKKDEGPSQEEIRELEKRKKLKTTGWAFFGLTVAFLAAGGASGGVALARKNDVVDIEDEYQSVYDDEHSTQQELDVLAKRRDDKYNESMNASIASTALFAAAGATALISFILLPLGYKKTGFEKKPEVEVEAETGKKANLDLQVSPNYLGISLNF
jgi:hypothetical protein